MKLDFYKVFLLLVALFCLSFIAAYPASAQEAPPAEVGVFEDVEVTPNTRFEIPVSIRGVEDLYAVDFTLSFDPELMQIEDADPDQAGVQPALGTFLDAGLVLFNTADNDSGTVRFAMTQVNPSEPKSGEGVLLVLYVQALAEGESPVTVESVELSNRAGEVIPVTGVGALVEVSDAAAEKESTPIPVQDPTGAIQVPSPQPTATPTNSPDPTRTPTSESVESATEAQSEEQQEDLLPTEEDEPVSAANESEQPLEEPKAALAEPEPPQEEPSDNPQPAQFMLLRYWWAVAILVVLVAGLGIYLAATRK